MTLETFLSLLGLAFAGSFTPGPNNAMLASSGATYGMRATLPHIFGVSFGFPAMIFLVGLGFGRLFMEFPLLQDILRLAGALMMVWIAVKIALADTTTAGQGRRGRPLSFAQAAGFQWVNPKAWMMSIAVTSQFITPENALVLSSSVAAIFILSGLGSTFFWTGFGQVLRRWLHTPRRLKTFNIAMAGLILGFLSLLLWEAYFGF